MCVCVRMNVYMYDRDPANPHHPDHMCMYMCV